MRKLNPKSRIKEAPIGSLLKLSIIHNLFLFLLAIAFCSCSEKEGSTTDQKYTLSKEEAAKIVSKGTGYPLSIDFSIKEGTIPANFIWKYGNRNPDDYFRVLQNLDSAGYIKISKISVSTSNPIGAVVLELTEKGRRYFNREEDSVWTAPVCKIGVLEVESVSIDTFYIGEQKMASALITYTFGYFDFIPFYDIIKPIPYFRNLDTDSVRRLRTRLVTYKHGWRVHYGIR